MYGIPDKNASKGVGPSQGKKAHGDVIDRQWAFLGIKKGFGGVLLSHTVARAVPSAQKSLTAVFGMETGVTSLLLPPKIGWFNFNPDMMSRWIFV